MALPQHLSQAPMIRAMPQQAFGPAGAQLSQTANIPPVTPGRTNASSLTTLHSPLMHQQPPQQAVAATAPPGGDTSQGATPGLHGGMPSPGRSGNGPYVQTNSPGAYQPTSGRNRTPSGQQERQRSGTEPMLTRAEHHRSASEIHGAASAAHQASTSSLRRGQGTHSSAALLAPAAMAIAASTPVLRGGRAGSDRAPGARATSPGALVSKSSLLAGSSLGALISKVTGAMQEREQEMRRQKEENRELDEILARSKEELQQLVSVVSQLHELQQSATDVLPDMLSLGPERPRLRGKPPFFWQPSQEYADEFEVSGECSELVTKIRDFEDQGWVIPVGGSWRLTRGGIYRWTVRVERKCPSRPQLQLGIHGMNHSQPWRLVTTSRCSWSRDDEPWQDRPGGDRLIDEGDYVHVEVDLRGVRTKAGTMTLAINDESFEQFFDDIPLNTSYPLVPVVSMGGDQSRVRLCPSY